MIQLRTGPSTGDPWTLGEGGKGYSRQASDVGCGRGAYDWGPEVGSTGVPNPQPGSGMSSGPQERGSGVLRPESQRLESRAGTRVRPPPPFPVGPEESRRRSREGNEKRGGRRAEFKESKTKRQRGRVGIERLSGTGFWFGRREGIRRSPITSGHCLST